MTRPAGIAAGCSVRPQLFDMAGGGSNAGLFPEFPVGSDEEVFVIVDESAGQRLLSCERGIAAPDHKRVERAVVDSEDDQVDCDVHR